MKTNDSYSAIAQDLWVARLRSGRPGRLVVRSGSMLPLLRIGEQICVVPGRGWLLPGDLVVFRQAGNLICHRLLLPCGPGRYWQKGDQNRGWERVNSAAILGRPDRIIAGDQAFRLTGPRFRLCNALLWLLVLARDLVRLPGRVIRPLAGVGEVLFSRLIAAIIGQIRKQEESRERVEP